MGCFTSKRTNKPSQLFPDLTRFPLSEYPRKATLRIVTAASTALFTLSLPDPVLTAAELLPFAEKQLYLSCKS